MSRSFSWGILIALSLNVIAVPVAGGEKDLSKKHFKAGLSLLATDNYTVAAQEFEKSVNLNPSKGGYFNLAICYYELRRYNEAIKTIAQLKKHFAESFDEEWQHEIAEFENKLLKSIVSVIIKTNIEGAIIRVDGEKINGEDQRTPLLLDPGEHEVSITADDYEDVSDIITIKPGQGKTEYHFLIVNPSEKRLKKEKASAPIQDTSHPVHFKDDENRAKKNKKRKPRIGMAISLGIGGLTGAAAITTGIVQLVGVSEIRDICGGKHCPDTEMKPSLKKMKKLGVATNVLISISAVALVTGTILAFVEGRKDQRKQRVSLTPSIAKDGGGITLKTTF